MGKLQKNRKRTKTKLKKKSTSKSKSRSTSKKIPGAPENLKSTMELHDIEDHPSDLSEASEILYKFVRKAMRVDHIECEDKAIRKAQRALKKIENSGSSDEIDDAKLTLQEAIQEKEEANKWMHPSEAVKKLSQILQDQIENSEDMEIIEMTKEFISDAEDSLRFIDQGQEDTFFYKLIQTNKSLIDLTKSNNIINDSDSENESTNILPSIEHQEFMEDNQNASNLFIESQQSEQNDYEIKSHSDQNSLDDGQKTPVAGSTTLKSVNVIQTKLNEALKILSPQEKIMKMKKQAKLNAQKKKQKLEEMNNERHSRSSKSQEKNSNKKLTSDREKKSKSNDNKSSTKKNRYNSLESDSETSNTSSASKADSNNESDTTSVDNCSHHSTFSDDMSEDDQSQDTSENEIEEESDNEISKNEESDDDSNDEHNNTPNKKSKMLSMRKSKKPNSNSTTKSTQEKKQTTISVTRSFNVYYSVKLHVEKGAIPTKQLEKALKNWYKQLLLMDSSVVIYKFEGDVPNEAIIGSKNIPSNFSTMKQFFNNINVKPNGGHSWFQVWLGHDESYDNILTNIKHWSTTSNTSMYRKRLQHKHTSKDYWLLWSTERMDTEALHIEVSTLMKKYSKKDFAFSFNFSYLRKQHFNKSNDENKWNRALVVEAKREDKDQIYSILGRIFSTANNIKVLGTNLRMIPMLNNEFPSHTKMKISHLIAKQEQFLSTLIVKPCLYINEIDYYNTNLDTTMRDIIMNLETLRTFNSKGEPMKIFQNVDYSSWHSCYVVTYPKHLEKEAEDFISQLPAYLHYIYGNEVLHMLSTDGVAKAHSSKWDPETLCATSNLDLELDAVATESSDKGWLPSLQMEVVEFNTENIEWQAELHKRATGADSVSTFASKSKLAYNQNEQPNLSGNVDSNHDRITPIKNPTKTNKSANRNKKASNIISPSQKDDNRSPSTTNSHKTRESGGYDGMKTPRNTASDLGGSL